MKTRGLFFKILCLSTIFFSLFAIAQPVQVNVMVNPFPSPYFSDWEVDNSIVAIHFNGNFPQPVNVVIELSIVEDQQGEIVIARSEIIQLDQGPWNLILNNPEVFNWPFFNYSPVVEQAQVSGIMPDGNYTICAQVINTADENSLGNGCGYFNVLLPEPPQITAPVDGQACFADNFIIQWMPVQWVANHSVFYNVTVTEIYPNQMAQEAIESNPSHFEGQVEGATVMLYPFQGLPLDVGHQYAIQVQSVDENGNPIGSNDGFSQVEYCVIQENNGTVYDYPWQEDSETYTSDEFLENVTLGGDPCDIIKKLIEKLQNRLVFVLFKQGEAKDRSDKAKEDKAQADKDIAQADKDLNDANNDLKKANKDRKTILDAIVKSSGGEWSTWNNGKPGCKADAVVGPSNGDLQLGGNNAICLGQSQISDFIEAVNKSRDDLKALNKDIKKAEKSKAKAEKAKADAEARKAKAEKDQEAADKDYDEWTKEADALQEALDELKEVADECLIIIEDLKVKYNEAKEKIDEATENLEDAKKNGGGGANSEDAFEEAQEKIDEANKNLENGDYDEAGGAAGEAEEYTDEGIAWSEPEDCLKKAKRKLKKAKDKLAEKKAEFPGGDFSEAEDAIAQAESDLAAAEAAYADGNLEAVNDLCPKIIAGANSAISAAESITCNEGDTKEFKNQLVEEHFVGTLIMPWGVKPDNLGYKMKELLYALGDPFDVASYVDMLYSLSSVSYASTIYDMYYEKRCTEVLVCRKGQWVHEGYIDCTEGLTPRTKVELVINEIDLKERLEADLSNIFDELKSYLKK